MNLKEFATNFLNEKKIDFIEKDGKIIISDEFQHEEYDEELGFSYPYILTEYNYPHSLNEELSEFNNILDEKFGHIFECEWAGTFSLIVE